MTLKLWFLSLVLSIIAPIVLKKPKCKQREKPVQKNEPFNPHSYFQNRLVTNTIGHHTKKKQPNKDEFHDAIRAINSYRLAKKRSPLVWQERLNRHLQELKRNGQSKHITQIPSQAANPNVQCMITNASEIQISSKGFASFAEFFQAIKDNPISLKLLLDEKYKSFALSKVETSQSSQKLCWHLILQ